MGTDMTNKVKTNESRTFDGSGNNKLNPDWGAANTPLLKIVGQAYADGFGSLPREQFQPQRN